MKYSRTLATALTALLALVSLADCSTTSGAASLAPSTISASASARTQLTVTISRSSSASSQSATRVVEDIPSTALSVDAEVWSGAAVSGSPLATSCVAFNGASTVTLSVSVPEGLDTIKIQSWNSGCSSAAGGQGTTGTGTSLSSFTGTGTVTPTSTDMATVFNAGQPIILIPATIIVTGTLTELVSGTPISGATVTVGSLPVRATCLNGESNTTMNCGIPGSPIYTTTTSTSGSFSVTAPTNGSYMLTISDGPQYATLHRTITMGASSLALGAVKIAALSTDEQAWLIDVNNQRATVSNPISFSNLTVDEYAEEQARAEVLAIVTGADPYGDATEEIFDLAYVNEGGIYSAASVADLVNSQGAYLTADANWMAEKANCPAGNWQTCTYAENTGHYMNISSTGAVWIGLAESASSYNDPPYGNEWAYAMIIPTNDEGTDPASVRNASVMQPKR